MAWIVIIIVSPLDRRQTDAGGVTRQRTKGLPNWRIKTPTLSLLPRSNCEDVQGALVDASDERGTFNARVAPNKCDRHRW